MAGRTRPAADLIAEVFRRGGMKRGVKRAESVLLWPQVAGPELTRFTQARSLQDGVLIVEVPDSETAMHLTLQRQRFLDVYRAKFGVKEIRDVRFRVGYRPVRPAPERVPDAPVDPKELARLARVLGELELPDELARPTMRAARSMLAYRARRLAEGWRPCPICEALTADGRACDACARYALEPRVERATETLCAQPDAPTPLLSEEERLVAIHRAKARLKERMAELLPQVLAEPDLRPQLERAAVCYVALERGCSPDDVSEDDLDGVDARVARALGRWR
jgi:hypothetical protein